MAREQDDRAGWIGIPSVPPERAAQAFVSFYLAITIAIVVDALLIANSRGPVGWRLVAEEIFDDGGSIVAWALAATWPIMEAMRMVLAGIFEKRIFRRGREQGREEGREEMNQRWAEWNQRREQAEAQGQPFTEPAPNRNNTGGNF